MKWRRDKCPSCLAAKGPAVDAGDPSGAGNGRETLSHFTGHMGSTTYFSRLNRPIFPAKTVHQPVFLSTFPAFLATFFVLSVYLARNSCLTCRIGYSAQVVGPLAQKEDRQ